MSLSASSMMSRVKSLMVSSVIELFWRRCLHVWKEGYLMLFSSGTHWEKFCFPDREKTLLQSYLKPNALAYLATFLLDSLLPALDRGTKQQENWSGKEKKDGGRRHYLLKSTNPTSQQTPVTVYYRTPNDSQRASVYLSHKVPFKKASLSLSFL